MRGIMAGVGAASGDLRVSLGVAPVSLGIGSGIGSGCWVTGLLGETEPESCMAENDVMA